jgi:thiol-disulfide isomerase/thioredoxin
MKSWMLLIISVSIYTCNNPKIPNPVSEKTKSGLMSGHYEIIDNINIDHSRCVLISDVLNSDPNILSNLLPNKFAGKVVYVDLWATWCRPCIQEIPYAKQLQSKFENKDVVFLTICCNSKLQDWKNIIVEYQLYGEHHLFNNEQCNFLKEAFLLTSYPSYLIFDKKGKLIDAKAPRPSDPNSEIILNQILSHN